MLNEKPTVSVIIPTYNRAHLIGRSILSVLDQTYQDFEIIVVDDGSTDNTEGVVKNFKDTRIRYVKHQQNKGGGAARNTGIELAKGEYIAFQDSDDEWLPEKLERQLDVFKETPMTPRDTHEHEYNRAFSEQSPDEVGVVYTGFQRIKSHNTKHIPSNTITKKEGNIHNTLLKRNFVTTQVAMVKKECFKKAGMFDERLPRLQDWELWIRISKYYNFKCIDEPLARLYPQSVSITSKQDNLTTALKIIIEKHFIDFSEDKKILALHYFSIGQQLYFCGKKRGWEKYYRDAIKANPFDIKLLASIFISIFGQNVYTIMDIYYQKVKRKIV